MDDLILTFENQTKIMSQFLPEDVQGAVKEFNKVSENFRSYIMTYKSGLNMRSAGTEGGGK
jgi:hypothetical protein